MGQAGRAAPDPQPAASSQYRAGTASRTAPAATDRLQQLKQLGDLKAQGVLTEQEFAAEKAKILAG